MPGAGGTAPSSGAVHAASAEVEAAYQDLILRHYRRPRNKGTLKDADARAAINNPLCGDELEVQVALEGDRVRDACFTGRGCSISQASASMMTEVARGRTRREIVALAERVAGMVRGDAPAAADESLGDLRALSGVARLPARHRCALLPWKALEMALAKVTR
jgi:nitrogen fixation NifU-like protein